MVSESDPQPETMKVKELSDDLELEGDHHTVNKILDAIGVEHDPDSLVLEDSYSTLFVGYTQHGDYAEVWGVHKDTAYRNTTAYKLL